MGYWISFALLFPIIVLGVASLKVWVKNNYKGVITPEMDKAANQRMVRYVLFYWLCNLFYMACFIHSTVCKFVFGILIVLIVFMNLVGGFTFPKERNTWEKWGLLQDFLVGVGLSVYLIYIIPNDSVKQVLIPIVAAMFGGLLTLVGVAWTIRQGQKERAEDRRQLEEDRKEEERKKYYPIASLYPAYITPDCTVMISPTHKNVNIQSSIYKIETFFIRNTDFSSFFISKLIIDNENYSLNTFPFVEKKAFVKFDLSKICLIEVPKRISIIIEDMIGNGYTMGLDFKVNTDNSIKIVGCYHAIINEKEK